MGKLRGVLALEEVRMNRPPLSRERKEWIQDKRTWMGNIESKCPSRRLSLQLRMALSVRLLLRGWGFLLGDENDLDLMAA